MTLIRALRALPKESRGGIPLTKQQCNSFIRTLVRNESSAQPLEISPVCIDLPALQLDLDEYIQFWKKSPTTDIGMRNVDADISFIVAGKCFETSYQSACSFRFKTAEDRQAELMRSFFSSFEKEQKEIKPGHRLNKLECVLVRKAYFQLCGQNKNFHFQECAPVRLLLRI